MDFQALLDLEKSQALTNGGMLDVVNPPAILDARVDDAEAVVEKRRQGARRGVAVLVDARAEHLSAVGAIPRRIVRSSTEERNAERCTTDDHRVEVRRV